MLLNPIKSKKEQMSDIVVLSFLINAMGLVNVEPPLCDF